MTEQLLETWDINARLNHYMLEAIPDEHLALKAEKGKTVGVQFAHIHNVRLMWFRASYPALVERTEKLDDGALKQEILDRLKESDAITREVLEMGIAEGKVKGFKPHPTAFLGYLIAHEATHRSQADFILRLKGHPIPDKIHYGLWEWGVR